MLHSRKKCGRKIPHLMWMVIYAHSLCTYILLNVYVSCIRNFLHKKCGCFWQVRLTAELFFNVNYSRQRKQRDNKNHSRRQRKPSQITGIPQGLTCPLCAPWLAEHAAARQAAGRLARQMGQAGSIYSTLLYLVLICINVRKLKSENLK